MNKPEDEEEQTEDPAIAEYRSSGDADMGAAAKLSYQHELNVLNNSATANEETNKQIVTALGQDHSLVPEFSDQDAITIKRPNNDYILAVRGTRITNISDLISDEQILVGANVNRFDKIDKVYNALREKNPKSKITITGHSLGGYVAKAVADKYEFKDKKLEMVGFDVAASPIHIGATLATAIEAPQLIPGLIVKGVADSVSHYVKKAVHGSSEYGNNRVYETDTFDLISVMNKITNFKDDVKILPQRVSRKQWLGSHSIDNYVLEPQQKAMKTYILKTQQGNKTYYTSPQTQIKKETYDYKPNDFCSNNPNAQKCKAINKKI